MFINVRKYGPGWRPAFSAVVGVLWLIFVIAWLAFFASNIQPYEKNIAIILLSLLTVFVLLGGVWAIWAIRMIPGEGRQMMNILGFKSRMTITIILPFAAIAFLVYYFWFYDFTIWQHIAIILIIALAIGLLLGGVWSSWKKSMSSDFEKRMEDMGEEIGRNVEESMKKEFGEDKED